MNLELVKDKFTDPKAQIHLEDQLKKFQIHNNKDWKQIKKETNWIKEVQSTPRHIDKTFMFRDEDGNPDIPRYKK